MNGFAPPVADSPWREQKTEDGRTYYYHAESRITSWENPHLMTPNQRALLGTPFKEHKTEDGKPYWHDTTTGQTTWTMPDMVANNLKASQASQPPQRPPAAQNAWAAGPSYQPSHENRHERDEYRPSDRFGNNERGTASSFVQPNEPQYSSPEEAEAAFMKMLKRIGAQADWTWPQAIRAGVKDLHWRAIQDPKEREEAFKKYCHELRAQDKAKEEERQAKLRADFTDMLRSHSEIKHYTRWRTALPMIENEAIFRSAKDDTERRALFDEFILSLKKSHTEKVQEGRVSALDQLSGIFQGLELGPLTRWNAAEAKLDKNEQLKGEQFKSLTKVDFLAAFERHIKLLREEKNDREQAERQARRRVERKNRDAFKGLLQELRNNGNLKAGTKWKEIHELMRDDPRYLAILGQEGTQPLDLFWDALEEEEGKFRIQRRHALDVLEIEKFEVKLTTSFEEFRVPMGRDPRTANLDEQSLRAIYAYVMAKVKKRDEEERRDSEYVERRAADDFRSMLKRLDPPILVTDSYDSVRSRFENTAEYNAIKSDLAREAAFEKYIRRLKDKEKDRERSKRDPRDRERDRRDRDREYRNGHTDSHRRHRTRTRSPEHDPYAAERRQAQQDREARYRNNDSTGLSPPYRRNNRDDDRFDRPRRGSGDHYGRERREREAERERSYVSRADPRERSSELDYGDSRPVSTRRRRESDESGGRRESKRPRYSPMPDRARDRRSKTPVQTAPEPKEDPGLRSGSEEGEIEED